MTENNRVELLVDGLAYGGWERVEIQRGIEQIAGGFILQLTQRWPGATFPARLREGLACQVRIGSDVVITGYIDQYEPELTDTSSSIRVEGRDKTGDLVDCSAIYKGGQWHGVKLERIVRDIVAPFGLKVVLQDGLDQGEVFKSFALEDGEKAFDAIDRACRLRAVLCTSTPAGEVFLCKSGDTHTGVTLEEGVNVKRISATHTWKDRFSQIIVKGQTAGDDESWGASTAHLKSEAKDAEIDRYRPLVVMAEQGVSNSALKERAEWEVNVRMGRGKRGKAVVVGWRTGKDGIQGSLWLPNTLVNVISPRMNMDAEVLIVGCAYTITEQGTFTELTFALPEAFEQVEGVGRSKLAGRLKNKAHRKKKDEGFTASWERDPPKGKK
ncbi:phage baseplate assembly protein [Variovorax sp. VNK109]|uniref:phage baseplate assembly protein n=1 Tax=Variovorax sp. VNK109 TaxID=3400919 RepID=UPI003C07127D